MSDRWIVEPHETGMLEVGDGQLVYWESCGNPLGKPAVVLHGGPGSGCSVGMRRVFDPDRYRVILFDQRGAGRSRPRVTETTDLSANTTWHLVADIERLRQHLAIEHWFVFGGSWGSTLALAYAEACRQRVMGLLLCPVTMSRPVDLHWLYHESGRYLPVEWARFRKGVPEEDRDGDLVAAYHRLLNVQPDVPTRIRAARDWCDWEAAVTSLDLGRDAYARYADPAYRITLARLCAHYFSHNAWLEDSQLLRDIGRLAGIPGVLVHGRLDLGGPADVPYLLAEAWPDAELHFVMTGHFGGKEMSTTMKEAVERRFAGFE